MPGHATVHLLDVGTKDYGDALLCDLGGRTIMVDGGHPGDDQSGNGRAGLIDQLRTLFGHEPPFRPDLLLVSHAHLDHIGALPTMVGSGILVPEVALVADPDLGWGIPNTDPSSGPDTAHPTVAALREEALPSDRDDASLGQWIADAAGLEERYRRMLDQLRASGTTVIRHVQDSHAEIEADWKDLKLKILGPSDAQAFVCADRIMRSTAAIDSQVRDLAGEDSALAPVDLYRRIAGSGADAADAADRLGAAVNLLSVVVTFVADGSRVLLGGDMEWASDKLPDQRLRAPVAALRRRVSKLAPYGFLKLAHHGSRNGVDAAFLDAMGPNVKVGIVTGSGSADHPAADVLGLLASREEKLHWARTDRNGPSSVRLDRSGTEAFRISRGQLDDDRSGGSDLGVPASEAVETPPIAGGGLSAMSGNVAPRPATNLTVRSTSTDAGVIEIKASVPVGVATRITVEVQPLDTPFADSAPEPALGPMPSGRRLEGVLVVTATGPLGDNIGIQESRQAISALEGLGARIVDFGDRLDFATAALCTRVELSRARSKGTLILGGFDVVPAAIIDTLPPELRARMSVNDDPDDFRVWNDEGYGDIDGDGVAELPVSRIPDGRSKLLVERAIGAQPSPRETSAAVRNFARPFADRVYSRLPGQRAMLVSHPTTSRSVVYPLDADLVYLMLHGDWEEADVFEGEEPSRRLVRAIDVEDVGPRSNGVIFAGCCWGALTVDATGRDVLEGRRWSPRAPERSMALSFLARGAQAFVGCTGVHYSPIDPPLFHYGEPMHQFFFEELADSPAQALFDARRRYVLGIPHGPRDVRSQAIEYKIWRQFTCLGIGW